MVRDPGRGGGGAGGRLVQYLNTSSQPGWAGGGRGWRAIGYLASFMVVGGVLFGAFAETDPERRRRVGGLLGVIGMLGVVVAVLQVPYSKVTAVSYASNASVFGRFTEETTVAIHTSHGTYEVLLRGSDKAKHTHDVILHYVVHA